MKKRITFCLLILLSASFVAIGQINLGPDVSMCAGDSVTLTATGPYTSYSWNTGSTASSIKVKTSGTYIVTSYSTGTSGNLVVNGDFQAGNTGFTSSYVYNPIEGGAIGEGTYGINKISKDAHWDFGACTDHTTGAGKMLVANGTKTLNQKLWCQTVAVTPNTNYDFSTSVGSATGTFPAIMQFSINNIAIGSSFKASTTTCAWGTFNQPWNSGVNTTAQICIINKNTSSTGNDFMLDDIIFTKTDTVKVSDTVVVTVNQKPTINLGADKTGCSGSPLTLAAGNGFTSYTWSDGSTAVPSISVSTPGNYSVEVIDGKGCKNKDDINVAFSTNLKFSIGNDTTLCAGATITLDAGAGFSTYAWNGGGSGQTKAVTSSGQYIVNVTNTNGCSGADTINVTINPIINVSVPNSSVNICGGNTALLNPTVNGGSEGFSYLWTGSGSGTNPTFTASTPGIYTLTATDSKGCKNKVDVSVSVSANSKVSLGKDTVVCSAAGLTLDAGAGFSTYTWNGGGSGQTKAVTSSGQYIVNVTNNKGCSSADTINVTINPIINVSVPNNTVNICGGNSTLLNPTVNGGSGGFTYLWSGSGSGTNPSFTASVPGLYTLNATDSKGCKNKIDITVTVSANTNVSLGKDTIVCSSSAGLTLDAGAGFSSYSWSNGGSSQTKLINASGQYIVNVSNNGCADADTINILLNPAITVTFNGNINSICNGNSAILNPLVSGGTGSFTYLWTGSGAGTSPTYTATSAGSYTLTATDGAGCKASSTKTLSLQILNVNLLGGKDTTTLCTGESLALDAGKTTGFSYLWSTNAKTQSIKVTKGGKYKVTVSSGNCSGSDSITVQEIT
ncbi:MAG: hypothetical protein NT150_10780, partial [Bacteroidetes bacterium]|nr:hypothetical protein [Bacteroidota bacterium]